MENKSKVSGAHYKLENDIDGTISGTISGMIKAINVSLSNILQVAIHTGELLEQEMRNYISEILSKYQTEKQMSKTNF